MVALRQLHPRNQRLTHCLLSFQLETFLSDDDDSDIHNTLALTNEPVMLELAISYGASSGPLSVSSLNAH